MSSASSWQHEELDPINPGGSPPEGERSVDGGIFYAKVLVRLRAPAEHVLHQSA